MDTSNITNISARQAQPSQHLAGFETRPGCEPATQGLGRTELGACLTLVAPPGYTANDRREWLGVAMQTLSGIPADLLRDGCAAARLTCQFPSQIVPAIMAAVGDDWERRKRMARQPTAQPVSAAPRLAKPDYVSPEEATRILVELGLKRA